MSTPATIPGYILKSEIISTVNAMTYGKLRREIKVGFSGEKARTDGKTFIQLPALASGQAYEIKPARVLRGYANHETLHVIWSEIDFLMTFVRRHIDARIANLIETDPKKLATPKSRASAGVDEVQYLRYKIWRRLENALEDWRIESRARIDTPGTWINIGDTRDHVITRESKNLAAGQFADNPPSSMLATIVTWKGTVANKYPCSLIALDCLDQASKIWPDEYNDIISAWPDAENATSHAAIMTVALNIVDKALPRYLQQKNPKTPPPPPPPEPADDKNSADPQENGDAADQSSDDETSDDGDSPDTGDGAANQDDGDKTDQKDPSDKDDDSSKNSGDNSDDPSDKPDTSADAEKPDDDATQDKDQNGRGRDDQDDQPDDENAGGQSDEDGNGNGDADTDDDGDADDDDTASPSTDSDDDDSDPSASQTGPQDDDANDDNDDAGSGTSAPDKDDSDDAIDPDQDGDATPAGGAQGGDVGIVVIDDPDDIDEDTLDISDIIRDLTKQALKSPSLNYNENPAVISQSKTQDMDSYQKMIDECGLAASGAARALRTILMSQNRRNERRYLEDGDLDTSNVADIATSSPTIYRTITEQRGQRAAILLLIDHSQSTTHADTNEPRIKIIAKSAAVLLNAVATRRDVSTCVMTYTSNDRSPTIKVVSKFDTPPGIAKAALGSILTDDEYGCTPTHIGLLEAYKMIWLRPEPRKIIYLITDGEPDLPRLALEAAQMIDNTKVLLAGLGVGADPPSMNIRSWTTLRNIDELPQALTASVNAMLRPRA